MRAAVFDGPDRAAARAYMKGIGFDDEALSRPTIGVANTWIEAMPCNFHLRGLAEHVKRGVRSVGGTPMEFNTVAISDGITMGTQGMKTSLVSREVIADSIELTVRGYQFDAVAALSACDKTIPGCVMALARLDVPGVMLYGGSIAPGRWHGKDVTILDVFEAIGAHAAGEMSEEELHELEEVASPGPGACGGQFTANTMACAFEALGISPAGSSMVPAEDRDKDTVAEQLGELVIRVLAEDLRPSRIITRGSLENAIACVCASGGSTNGVLHLLAVAREAGVELSIDDFERISRRTPLLADLKPGGRFVATDLYAAGGVPLILSRLAEAGVLNEDEMTVTGQTIGEVAAAAVETPNQEVVRPLQDPLKAEGGLAILRGNLAPDGAVVKLAGTERQGQTGPARVFESEEECFRAVKDQAIEPGDVIVIRNEGPAGGPGMRALLGRHPWAHGRPCRPRGGQGRGDRGAARGRPGDDRRRGAHPGGGVERRGDRAPRRRVRAAAAALRLRGDGQVRRDGLVGVGWRGHELRKASRRRLKRTGRSAIGRWPHSSKITSSELRSSRLYSSASAGGTTWSLRPQTISVGSSTSDSRCRKS
jgi:dihydroxy-acid dehydratase